MCGYGVVNVSILDGCTKSTFLEPFWLSRHHLAEVLRGCCRSYRTKWVVTVFSILECDYRCVFCHSHIIPGISPIFLIDRAIKSGSIDTLHSLSELTRNDGCLSNCSSNSTSDPSFL